jgi:hypothetical protein
MDYTVYKHIFSDGKIYIGITTRSVYDRWSNGKGYRHRPDIMSAILKEGWNNIKHEIICEGLNKEEAEAKEKEMIALYKSDDPEYGYNIRSGGNYGGGKRVSQYTLDGILIETYDSIKEASEITGINKQLICRCCNKKAHTACGYIWRHFGDNSLDVSSINKRHIKKMI